MKYVTAVSDLLNRIPEFQMYEPAPEFDLPHDVFGSFALFLCDLVRQGANDELITRAFAFLNDMASSEDDDLVNLVVVSVLEIIADNDQCRASATAYFSERAKELLRRTGSGWKQNG